MPKNRFTIQPKQMGLAMSPAHSHTVNGAPALSPDDEDDGDICPVCDGECTCTNTNLPLRPPSPPHASPRPTGPLSMEELSRQFSSASSSSTPSFLVPKQPQRPPPPPPRPSLKIKLALPPSMLAKRHAPQEAGTSSSAHRKSKNQDEMMFVDGNVGENFAYIGPSTSAGNSTPTPSHPYTSHTSSNTAPAPRKRGRPRKIVPAPRDPSPGSRRDSTSPVHRRTNPKTNIIGRQKQQIYAQKFAKTLKARAPAPKKPKKAPMPKRRRPTNPDSSLSDLTDDDEFGGHSRAYDPDSEDDTASVQFPTFVSASALSSMDSGGDGNTSDSSSSLSDFDSDSSIKEEEEEFMVSEMQHDKVSGKRRDSNNEWVIKPRRKSVGLSDAEVEMDSDVTDDEEDEENEEAQRTIIAEPPVGAPEYDEGEETDGRRGDMKGLVTCWSDEESDSFDADVFFANLSSESDSTDDEAKESAGNVMDDDDETSSDVSTEAELMHMREELENLPLELAESWDGQLMFTNGTLGGQAIIDIDFEVNASQFVTHPIPNACFKGRECCSPTHNHCMPHEGVDSDIQMSDVDDGGYEEDAGEGEGDTTDEELVGEDDLPNERAMRLFNFPLSVSAINPLSTVSPAVTPASKRPGPRNFDSSNRLQSPSPADILAGKVGWDSADEMDELFDSAQRGRRLVRGDGTMSEGENGLFMGPRKGVFVPAHETRQVVIDGSQKEVPSPHPRFNRRRTRRVNTVEALLRKHLLSIARNPSSFVPAATVVPDSSPLRLLPSVEISATATSAASGLLTPGTAPQPGDDGLAAAIDLDDVFESSFFNPDPSDTSGPSISRLGGSPADVPPDSTTADESDSNKNEMKHLHRWDVISVGAFRQTRESVSGILDSPATPGWSDHRRTPASSTDYGNVLKTGPLSTMLWPTGDKKKASSSRRVSASTAALGVSPLILPTPGDGDRTPTSHSHQHQQDGDKQQQQQQQQNGYTPKTRRELRKEKKSKQKYGHSPRGNHHPAHQYHSHHHHPNSKSRGGAQRTNFFLSSVPPLNI